jgi:hypothetical protein
MLKSSWSTTTCGKHSNLTLMDSNLSPHLCGEKPTITVTIYKG